MIDQEELPGRYVLVHPALWDDPADKNGAIGMIVEADLSDDLIRIRFDDDTYAFYATDALLIFQVSNNLYGQLKQNAALLTNQNFKDLKTIARLLDYGRPEQVWKAMELVQENPDLLVLGMISLEDHLANGRLRQHGR